MSEHAFHPIAELFPLMVGAEFDALRTDIAENGLREAIWLHPDGRILDGRNRYRACLAAGVAPRFVTCSGKDELAFIISANLRRRHLNETQRAIIAGRLETMKRGRPTNNDKDANWRLYHSEAAALLNVSPRTVTRVKAVEKAAPELVEKMERGEMAADAAAKEVKLRTRKRENDRRLAQLPSLPTHTGGYELNQVYCADATSPGFIGALEQNSIDLVFTDPPWHEDKIILYARLAELAAHVLKPGRHLLVYAGKMFLPEIMDALKQHLEYCWMLGIFQPDSNNRINKYQFYSAWRPVLVYRKPGAKYLPKWTPDSARSTRDKSFHEWGQGVKPIEQWLTAFSDIGEIVLDPFSGGGAIPAVAKQLSRRWLAFDVNPEAAQITIARLSE